MLHATKRGATILEDDLHDKVRSSGYDPNARGRVAIGHRPQLLARADDRLEPAPVRSSLNAHARVFTHGFRLLCPNARRPREPNSEYDRWDREGAPHGNQG